MTIRFWTLYEWERNIRCIKLLSFVDLFSIAASITLTNKHTFQILFEFKIFKIGNIFLLFNNQNNIKINKNIKDTHWQSHSQVISVHNAPCPLPFVL